MKPIRLELRGFTAFRRPAVVNFKDRSLFAITGPTGAGKSSLLDAMTWALYGHVPRVGRATHQLVTHGEKSMAVRFDFSARGQVFRVTRTTAGAIGTRLEQRVSDGLDGGRWKLLADRAGDVTKQVGDVIGLDYATFIKTIVLPQGEFGSFLRGEERERRDILSTLLGLGTYEAAGHAARSRAREAQQAVAHLNRQLENITFATPEALKSLLAERLSLAATVTDNDAMQVGLRRLTTVATAHVEATRALTEAERADAAADAARAGAEQSLIEAQTALEGARAAVAQLSAERTALGYDAAAHRRVQQAVQFIDARAAGLRALEEARVAETLARAVLDEATHSAIAAEEHRAAQRTRSAEAQDAHAGALASLRSRVLHGRSLAIGLATAEHAAEAAENAADETARAADEEAATLGESMRQAEALATDAREIALEEERVATALEAARVDLAALEGTGVETASKAAIADATLTERRVQLEAIRTQHAAAALRADLAPGDPCPVCGGPITQLALHTTPDLDAADAAVNEAGASLRRALDEQRTSQASAAAAAARLQSLDEERKRVQQRRAVFESRAGSGPRGQGDAAALATAVRAAVTTANGARTEAAQHHTELALLRNARHTLELRLAEAAPRLGARADGPVTPVGTSTDGARELTMELSGQLAIERTLASRLTAAEEEARLADEVATRTIEEAARASVGLEDRAAATRAAEHQLETMTGGALDPAWGDDPCAVLAWQDALAAQAVRIDESAELASTELAVRTDRALRAQAPLDRARTDASAASTALEGARTAAAAADTVFAAQWRELLGSDVGRSVLALQQLTQRVEAEARELAGRIGSIEARLDQARAEVKQASQLRNDIAGCEATASISGALERELQADHFIAYVQHEALSVLAADASSRLLHLTGGRYRLVGESDEFYVIDHLNGDEKRSVRTLSGGETFLASVALALALSERLPELAGVGAALSLESLFIDEGFGSLDPASLDIAIEGLERLAGGHRLIGVISHVPEIAERLPDRIEVLKAPEGSTIAADRDRIHDISDFAELIEA
ncbi:MAG: SMC family ATPase [Dehalococcoidia bacterium]|nr:SMC family ATPase [Dehalococcoidia bacterium]